MGFHSVLSWGPQHTSWLPFGKKAFWNVLVKICEVIKGKVDCKWSFCFNYAQVSGNMELLIKAFGELMITAVVRLLLGRNREPGYPTSRLWPLLQSTRPAAAPVPVCVLSGIRAGRTTPSHRGSDCSLNFASDPACWSLRREVFTSSPNEMELQKNHSRGHSGLRP